MSSDVEIANAAIQKLGSPRRIESLDEDHQNARSLNAAFIRTRQAELRRYTWGFAVARASIAADPDQTEWGEWNRFSLPNGFLRLIRDDETGQATDWRIEGQFIVTADAAPLNIRYVVDVTDANAMDALFRESFACKLAHECCKEITGGTELKARQMEDYKFAIDEAKRVGAIEKEAQQFPEDDWVNARI